jgi:hypothetical protein
MLAIIRPERLHLVQIDRIILNNPTQLPHPNPNTLNIPSIDIPLAPLIFTIPTLIITK